MSRLPEKVVATDDESKKILTQYGYIVIGAGSAGCVVANPAECVNLIGSEVDWGYFSEPEPYLNQRKIFCSRGKVLGGSSSINFMMYVRGNHHDYDRWQELGNPGWSYRDVLPYFKKSENQQRGASEFHGTDGELSVTDLIAPAPISQRFIGYCQLNEKNPELSTIVPLQSRSV
jgi:choline dehydrogenase